MLSAILYLAAPVVVCLIKSMIRIMTIGVDVGEGIGDGVGDNVGDNNVGDDVGDDVGDNNVGDDVGDGVGLRRIAPLGFRSSRIVGVARLPFESGDYFVQHFRRCGDYSRAATNRERRLIERIRYSDFKYWKVRLHAVTLGAYDYNTIL